VNVSRQHKETAQDAEKQHRHIIHSALGSLLLSLLFLSLHLHTQLLLDCHAAAGDANWAKDNRSPEERSLGGYSRLSVLSSFEISILKTKKGLA
jgi:hypothetical protein